MKNRSITEVLNDFNDQKENFDTLELWFDWFCRKEYLQNKGISLLKKVKRISSSLKFDNDKCYIFFKNSCPMCGHLYDEFKICNEEGDVIFCVTPKSGHDSDKGLASVYGRENNFTEPLVKGNWKDIVKWFNTI